MNHSWKIMHKIISRRQKKKVFLMTMSLRDTMTFKSFNTELLIAYIIPKENMQLESYRNYTYLNLDLLPRMPSFYAITTRSFPMWFSSFTQTGDSVTLTSHSPSKFINKYFEKFVPCRKARSLLLYFMYSGGHITLTLSYVQGKILSKDLFIQ